MEQLALSTSYPLRHSKRHPSTSSSSSSSLSKEAGAQLIRTNRPRVDLGMELDMESIAEPLRLVAAGVFEEMESLKRQEFTAAVNEFHQNSEGGGGGEGSGAGEGGGRSEGSGGGGEERLEASKTTLDEKETEELEDGGIVLERNEFIRAEKEKNNSLHLPQEGGTLTKKNQHETKNNGSHQEEAGYTPSGHSSLKPHESDHNVITTSSLGRAAVVGGSEDVMAGLSQLSAQEQLLTSESLAKETEKTLNFFQHTALAKDKAA